MAYSQEPIDKPYQIICEGADDHEFFKRLIRDRHFHQFQVGCGRGADGRCLGRSGFSKRIEAVKNFATVQIEGYIIIADCDDDPIGRFNDARSDLRSNHLPVPDKPYALARATDGTKSAVMMIPSIAVEGGLETLLLLCCDAVLDHADCIDAFCGCVTRAPRKIDRDKLHLRALIAATNPDDPGVSITSWVSEDRRPFRMQHPALDPISNFLTSMAA